MNEHLPECWAKAPSDPSVWCICDELRACEERVLNAARKAVGSMEIAVAGNSAATVDQALDVIDALREASND